MQFDFIFNPFKSAPADPWVTIAGQKVPLLFVRSARARRYVLRLRPDGSARITIPRRGSLAEAQRFVARQTGWLERQLHRLATRPKLATEWQIGSEIFFRGELVKIEAPADGLVRLGPETIKVPPSSNLRPAIENHLWKLAAKELPPQVLAHAARLQLAVRRITVRNQKSRWGSCSRRGTISLNWRLIQAPPHVQDYIILHELCHLRELNHSHRFWREVEKVCPDYQKSERWLKEHPALIG